MKLQLSAADLAFREEVRAFLREHLTPEVQRRSRIGMHPPHDGDRTAWNRVLAAKGWSAPLWPKEYGGTGWTHLQHHIYETECRLAHAPELRWQGIKLIGPVIYTFGTAEQKARFLPPTLTGEFTWAQGFSEPGAGSDLASLKTTAVLDGEFWVVNGQKLWTTEGQFSNMGFFLVRTAQTERPHKGISMLVLDMKSPGVTVRTIPMINGDHSTCEVFLDNVRVPKDNLIGEPGTGWDQARFLLGNERTSSADIYKSLTDLARIRSIAAVERVHGRPLLQDPGFARKLAALEIEVRTLEWSVLRVMAQAPSEHPIAAAASVLKVRGSELQQRLTELATEALGPRALREFTREEGFADAEGDALWHDGVPGVTVDQMYLRAVTIFGGAKEVQKNIIAKLAFSL
ncbi:MAG: acyl-CoA dehydrogenase family protein [Rubrivivax sp.]|nr:acyl-CoA dehydrogenase family protein [Rubrivivax sp.]